MDVKVFGGFRADPFGVHRLREDLPTCSPLRRRRALRGLPAAWLLLRFHTVTFLETFWTADATPIKVPEC